jgi:GNAT superfamily N-acetyltransferase
VTPRPAVRLREARLADVPALQQVIAASARALSRGDYSEAQIEAALGTAWGVDSELIRDATYFAVESSDAIVACGGWSRRRTLFGADAQPGRESALLDPRRDAARIRAFFVHPGWARRGIGRLLLERCEAEARAAGFRTAELMATLPGQRLYRACGYIGEERITFPIANDLTIDFIPMRKRLPPP